VNGIEAQLQQQVYSLMGELNDKKDEVHELRQQIRDLLSFDVVRVVEEYFPAADGRPGDRIRKVREIRETSELVTLRTQNAEVKAQNGELKALAERYLRERNEIAVQFNELGAAAKRLYEENLRRPELAAVLNPAAVQHVRNKTIGFRP
jgi:hypothetical protein